MPKNVTTTRKPPKKGSDIDVIILSARMGNRMKSYGPRALMKLNKHETVLDRQIHVVKTVYNNCNISVSVGFEADKIIKKYSTKVSLIEHQLHDVNNEAEEAKIAINTTTSNNVLLIGGNVLFNLSVLHSIELNESGIVLDTKGQMGEKEASVSHMDGSVLNISYGFEDNWSNIVYLTGNELRIFREIIQAENYKKYFLFEIVNEIINNNGKIRAYQNQNNQLANIDSYAEFLDIKGKEYYYV